MNGLGNAARSVAADPMGNLVGAIDFASTQLFRVVGSDLQEVGTIPGKVVWFGDDDTMLIHGGGDATWWRAGDTEPIEARPLEQTSNETDYTDIIATPDGKLIIAVGRIPQRVDLAAVRTARNSEREIGWYVDIFRTADGKLVRPEFFDETVDKAAISANGQTFTTMSYGSLSQNGQLKIWRSVMNE